MICLSVILIVYGLHKEDIYHKVSRWTTEGHLSCICFSSLEIVVFVPRSKEDPILFKQYFEESQYSNPWNFFFFLIDLITFTSDNGLIATKVGLCDCYIVGCYLLQTQAALFRSPGPRHWNISRRMYSFTSAQHISVPKFSFHCPIICTSFFMISLQNWPPFIEF